MRTVVGADGAVQTFVLSLNGFAPPESMALDILSCQGHKEGTNSHQLWLIFTPSPSTTLQTTPSSYSAGASFLFPVSLAHPPLLASVLGGHHRGKEPNSCVLNIDILYGRVSDLQTGIFPSAWLLSIRLGLGDWVLLSSNPKTFVWKQLELFFFARMKECPIKSKTNRWKSYTQCPV